MSEQIGYQSGIKAAMAALRKEFPQYTAAWSKLERTLTILANEHDSSITPTEPPPPPPPPSFKRVAPRVAYKAGGSDARYCLKDFPTLRDDVATYDQNGLCNGGRSDGSAADCPTSALEINGREYCDLPTQGDPTKNTGSWKI